MSRGDMAVRLRWRRAVDRSIEALVSNLGRAFSGQPEALHAARVASRRVRETVALVRPAISRRRYARLRRGLRRITRLLGPVRELDVSLALLDDLRVAQPYVAADVQVLRGRLAARREERLQRASVQTGAGAAQKVGRKLSRALDKLEHKRWAWRHAAGAHIDQRGRQLLDAIARAGMTYSPKRLHRARIALKRFRYAVELVSAGNGTTAKRLLVTFRQAQDILGRMHDLHVVAASADDSDRLERDRTERLQATIDGEVARLHAKYLALRTHLVASVQDAVGRFGSHASGGIARTPGDGDTREAVPRAARYRSGAGDPGIRAGRRQEAADSRRRSTLSASGEGPGRARRQG